MDLNNRFAALAAPAFLGFMLAVAGCQSGDALKPGADAPPPPTEKITESELRAYCPKVTLRDGTAFFNTYQKGGKKRAAATDDSAEAGPDPNTLVYQASIADVTRSCTYSAGTMTMNVAVAGRVVPGPAGVAGTITMPIRIVVLRGEEVLYSQLHQYKVTIPDATTTVQFVFNDPNVVLPQPTSTNYRVYAGYDEGPAKDKKTASAQ